MKTFYIVSSNERFKTLFEFHKEVELAVLLKDVQEDVDCDVILLDGELVHHQDLSDVRNLYPNTPIFYKLAPVPSQIIINSIKTMCEAYNIKLLSEYSQDEQVVNDVLAIVLEQERTRNPKIVSFFGTHSGAGVSTTVFSVAKVLAEQVEQKVIVLSLNPWDPSDCFLDYRGRYLNELKLDLRMNELNEKKFMDSVYYYEREGFYHLAGNWDIKMQRYFNVEEIAHLIDLANRCFDIVLIDAGTHYDNACSTQSFKSADLKFLVTTQEDKGYRCYWRHAFQQMIEPVEGDANNYMLILNRYLQGVSLINEKDMQKELEMSLLTTIPDQDIRAHLAVAEKKLLVDTGDNGYRKSIAIIVNSIIARAKLTRKPEVENANKGGLFKRIFKK